jgi:UDP-N-acetylmuramoyl-tripeptide--D-alanyl-D-alanine ligase
VRLLGRKTLFSVLAAVAVASEEGRPLDGAVADLERMAPVARRLQTAPLPNGAILLRDEYKSSLETVHAALDLLSEIPAKRRIVVLGEVSEPPGSQGPIYREIGARVAEIADRAIFVGANFQRYATGARRAGLERDALVDAGRDALRAAEAVEDDLRPGDVVLLKGRDTQRLERVALALAGRRVRCEITHCDSSPRCDTCPMLERGWDGLRFVV